MITTMIHAAIDGCLLFGLWRSFCKKHRDLKEEMQTLRVDLLNTARAEMECVIDERNRERDCNPAQHSHALTANNARAVDGFLAGCHIPNIDERQAK